MMRARGVMLVAMTCLTVGARAQELTISGRVVSADGWPLSMAFVNLDSLKIICRVDSNGNYVLLVPASVAHGQPEKLVARARGHLLSYAAVSLTAPALVRDFVLEVDTMPEHRRRHPTLSDGRTEKSATDLTITGRIVDSSGAAIRTADVRVEPGGFRAMTDDSGYYKLLVPLRMDRQFAMLTVTSFGFVQKSDSMYIAGTTGRRDFVLSTPIYSATAATLDSSILRAAGLIDLKSGSHRSGEREIRIRTEEGYLQPNLLYRFVNRSGKMTGELIRYVTLREDDTPSAARSGSRSFRRNCRGTSRETLPCRARFIYEPAWGRSWKTLDSLDIWNIADEGTLHKHKSVVFDGSSITAEMWDGKSYKAWAYTAGVEDDGPGRAKVTVVSNLLKTIASLMVP